jgi:hypothetical protein
VQLVLQSGQGQIAAKAHFDIGILLAVGAADAAQRAQPERRQLGLVFHLLPQPAGIHAPDGVIHSPVPGVMRPVQPAGHSIRMAQHAVVPAPALLMKRLILQLPDLPLIHANRPVAVPPASVPRGFLRTVLALRHGCRFFRRRRRNRFRWRFGSPFRRGISAAGASGSGSIAVSSAGGASTGRFRRGFFGTRRPMPEAGAARNRCAISPASIQAAIRRMDKDVVMPPSAAPRTS